MNKIELNCFEKGPPPFYANTIFFDILHNQEFY